MKHRKFSSIVYLSVVASFLNLRHVILKYVQSFFCVSLLNSEILFTGWSLRWNSTRLPYFFKRKVFHKGLFVSIRWEGFLHSFLDPEIFFLIVLIIIQSTKAWIIPWIILFEAMHYHYHSPWILYIGITVPYIHKFRILPLRFSYITP